MFPGEQTETWTYHRGAKAWYYHRFYDFQPDLNIAHPAVRQEIKKIMGFWLQLGVAGFRIDAAPFIIEVTEPNKPDPYMDFEFLTELREYVSWRRGDALLLAEANVPPEKLPAYFGDDGGSANRIHMLFDFILNDAMVLALARGSAEPIVLALSQTPSLPPMAQWATFLRNHDEIDLSRLTAEQRDEVFAAFGPDEDMRLYDRGIRRRLAPMLGGDRRRIELAYSLQFTLRGTPVLRYGEEIGMGDDLSLPGRNAIRTPMQWSSNPGAGFSAAAETVRPVIDRGAVRLPEGQRDRTAARRRFPARLVRADDPHAAGEPRGRHRHVYGDRQGFAPGVLVHRADDRTGTMVFLHNLADTPAKVDLSELDADADYPDQVFGDQTYDDGRSIWPRWTWPATATAGSGCAGTGSVDSYRREPASPRLGGQRRSRRL